MVSYHLAKGEQLERIFGNIFKAVEDITDVSQMTNEQPKQVIQKIEVDKEGHIDIFLRLFGDLGLKEAILIENTSNTAENMPNTEGNTPNVAENNSFLRKHFTDYARGRP